VSLGQKIMRNGKNYIALIILFLFPLTVFTCDYLLYSSDYYIEESLKKIEEEWAAKGEDVSDTIDMTKSVLRNPGFVLSFSFYHSMSILRNLFFLNLLIYVTLLLIVEGHLNVKEFLKLVSMPVLILIFGWGINAILKLALLQLNVFTNLQMIVETQTGTAIHALVRNIELFSIGYLIWLSLNVSKNYNEKFLTIAFVVFGNFLILTFSSVLIGFDFVLVS